DEKVFHLVSGKLASTVLAQIHSLVDVLVDVFTEQTSLLAPIKETINITSKETLAFSLYDSKQPEGQQKSTKDLSKESASFLWYQLLVNVLRQQPTRCAGKERYDQLLSKLLSNTKRRKGILKKDIDLLYLFRFFIIDLCKRLEEESQLLPKTDVLTLYRGQKIPNEEFRRLQNSVGALITTNDFFSTSRDINVALAFARQKCDTSGKKTVLEWIQYTKQTTSV
ncbi:unnamed protein product, partial [Didymodactylos carnosus]